ncbi:MAG: hypothetical protein K9M08_03240 [Pirellula sp.]|nr:hypothetical protein [Pirellula sp.]
MIWTTFSSVIFLSLGIIASYSIGGFAYLILVLVATVISIKAFQDMSQHPEHSQVKPFR